MQQFRETLQIYRMDLTLHEAFLSAVYTEHSCEHLLDIYIEFLFAVPTDVLTNIPGYY